MADGSAPAPRVSLTKAQLEEPAALELLQLLQSITGDGRLRDEEIGALRAWLDGNADSTVPGIEYLRRNVGEVLADGRVSDEERKWLQKSLETVLPKQQRDIAGMRRREAISEDRAERASAAPADRLGLRLGEVTQADGTVILANYDFMVSGVAYENRAAQARTVVPGQRVYLVRDPRNRYSAYAILVLLENGMEVGYMPDSDAQQLAAMLDWGARQYAEVKKVLDGSSYPIPVIWGELYHKDAEITGTLRQTECPRWAKDAGRQPAKKPNAGKAVRQIGKVLGQIRRGLK